MRVREIDRASEAIEQLEGHEPASSLMLAPILENGLTRGVRCWTVDSSDGQPAGLLVIGRYVLGSWFCRPLVLEPSAAPLIAALADRSPAHSIHGPAEHVAPLLPHLERGSERVSEPFLRLPEGAYDRERAADPRVRVAELADLGPLLDLYERYELESIPPIRRWMLLQTMVRRRMILVAEEDARIVGAYRLLAWTRRWAWWDDVTVLPEARGRGIAWALVHRGARETARTDRRWMSATHPDSVLAFPPEMNAETSDWMIAALPVRLRFRGEARLRRAGDVVERRVGALPVTRRLLARAA